jgi:hypothetical protein
MKGNIVEHSSTNIIIVIIIISLQLARSSDLLLPSSVSVCRDVSFFVGNGEFRLEFLNKSFDERGS